MTTLSLRTPQNKPHYVYSLAYPESMGGYVFYVGKGSGSRIANHEQRLRAGIRNKGDNAYKDNVIKKIWREGGEVVKEKIALFATHEEALQFEIALIFLMRPYGHLTNIADGGGGSPGYVPTEEMRRHSGETHRGKKRSEASRQRMSKAQRILRLDETWVQKNHEAILRAQQTDEWRQHQREAQKASPVAQANIAKMNAAKKGVPLSAEHCRKVGEAGEGRTFTEEHRRNLAKSKRGRKRAPFSDEWRRKMSESHRKK